jgi:hypothetical protein
MVLEQNIFIEAVLPAGMQRQLSDEEMDHYRKPFVNAGESRRPTLSWPRNIPIDGEPADVASVVNDYSSWLAQSDVPKLFVNADPGSIVHGRIRDAEVGDQAAIAALRQAAHSVGDSDPYAAADLSKRAVELLPASDSARGSLVAETVVLLNRAACYQEAQELADSALAAEVSHEDEAEIRLRLAAGNQEPERRIAENRRALRLAGINDVTRARHQAWLAYFESVNAVHGQDRSTATEAAAAATATGDLEARIVSETALAMLDLQDGYARRAIRRMDGVDGLTRSGTAAFGHIIAAHHRVGLVVLVGRLEEARAQVAESTEKAHHRYAMALPGWTNWSATVHVAAGRLAAARATIEALPPDEWGNFTEVNVQRMLDVRTDDRKLLQDLVCEALGLYPSTSPLVSCGAAYVVALAAWHRGDTHEAVRWLSGQNTRVITPLWPNVFDQLILMSRAASAAGDAGLRARVLQSIEVLERERPGVPLFAAVAQHTRGILERDADALSGTANALRTWRPLLYAEDAGGELARTGRNAQAIEQLNAAFDVFMKCEAVADARRVGRELRGLGVQRRIVAQPRDKSGWDSLTDAELNVVTNHPGLMLDYGNGVLTCRADRRTAGRTPLDGNTSRACLTRHWSTPNRGITTMRGYRGPATTRCSSDSCSTTPRTHRCTRACTTTSAPAGRRCWRRGVAGTKYLACHPKLSRLCHTLGETSQDALRRSGTVSQVRAHLCDNRQHIETPRRGL